jgi:hypothetical protein
MEDLDNLSEEDLQKLLQLGVIPDEQSSLDDQMKQAQMIRNRQAPRGTDTGRVYVAASPLEHIAYAMQGIKAGRDMDKLRDQQQSLLQQQISGRQSYMDALLGRLRGGQGKHSFSIKRPEMANVPFDESTVPRVNY